MMTMEEKVFLENVLSELKVKVEVNSYMKYNENHVEIEVKLLYNDNVISSDKKSTSLYHFHN